MICLGGDYLPGPLFQFESWVLGARLHFLYALPMLAGLMREGRLHLTVVPACCGSMVPCFGSLSDPGNGGLSWASICATGIGCESRWPCAVSFRRRFAVFFRSAVCYEDG